MHLSLPLSRNFEIQVGPLSRNPEGYVEIRSLPVEEDQGALAAFAKNAKQAIFAESTDMKRLAAALFRLLDNSQWREIGTAPCGRELELAVIDGELCTIGGFCLRHGDTWLDAETLRPVKVTATHWRSRWPVIFPVSCC